MEMLYWWSLKKIFAVKVLTWWYLVFDWDVHSHFLFSISAGYRLWLSLLSSSVMYCPHLDDCKFARLMTLSSFGRKWKIDNWITSPNHTPLSGLIFLSFNEAAVTGHPKLAIEFKWTIILNSLLITHLQKYENLSYRWNIHSTKYPNTIKECPRNLLHN